MAEHITSRTNPLMTHLRKLTSSRSYRREQGEYLGDGVKLLAEAVRWNAPLTAVVGTREEHFAGLPEQVRCVLVPEDLMASVSPMESPQGVLFTCKTPDFHPPKMLSGSRYLALEGVQDPGNVGTILRTADAFGADGVLVLGGCADLCNHKTVRSSMGAVFRIPAWSCTLKELSALCRSADLPLVGAALREDTVDVRQADLRRAVGLVGSEGQGLSEAALTACDLTVKIPMSPRCESLNVAVAAATLLWEGYR